MNPVIMKVAILTSHPIQYQAPLFRKLSQDFRLDLMVYFNWKFGVVKETYDSQFNKDIKWDIPLLSGYSYTFLKNFSLVPSSGFWGQINFGIIRELAAHRYDTIIVYGWNSLTNWIACITSFLLGTRVFVHAESPLNQELMKGALKLRMKRFVFVPFFKFCSGFLYLGEENRKFYRYYGVPDQKLFFCPYSVENERFISEHEALREKKFLLRKEIGISSGAFVILYLGKLIPKKRPFDLLCAFHELQLKNSVLVFVGDGALRSSLERYVQDYDVQSVYFSGFQNQTEIGTFYAMSDVFVLPSDVGETWGLVINEAMCFSLPVIVSDVVGCAPDLVHHGENGFIFPVGDVYSLQGYLRVLHDNPHRRKMFGEASFRIVQLYNHEESAKGIIRALGIER